MNMLLFGKKGQEKTTGMVIVLILLVALLVWFFVFIYPKYFEGSKLLGEPLEDLKDEKLKLLDWDSLTNDQKEQYTGEEKSSIQLASAEKMYTLAEQEWGSGEYREAVRNLERVIVITDELLKDESLFEPDKMAKIEDLNVGSQSLLLQVREAYGKDLMNKGKYFDAIEQFENLGDYGKDFIEKANEQKSEFEKSKNEKLLKYKITFSDNCKSKNTEYEIVWCEVLERENFTFAEGKLRVLEGIFKGDDEVLAMNSFIKAELKGSEGTSDKIYWESMNYYEDSLFKYQGLDQRSNEFNVANVKINAASLKEDYSEKIKFSKLTVNPIIKVTINEDGFWMGEIAIYSPPLENIIFDEGNTRKTVKLLAENPTFLNYISPLGDNDAWTRQDDAEENWDTFGPSDWEYLDITDYVHYEFGVFDGNNNELCSVSHYGGPIEDKPTLNLKDCGKILDFNVGKWYVGTADFEDEPEEYINFELRCKKCEATQ
jgi:hypothetical protein